MQFTHIDEALEVLMARRSKGLPGLDSLKKCLETLGNPHDKLKTIHIGGTNGKGSTTDYCRSILQVSGYKVASFTSPYLISHHDRFRINNQPISDEDLLFWINETYPLWDVYQMSMFVIDMLIAVLYFVDQNVDIALFEVGLGGRLDATNLIRPLASVITNIGYDHMEYLGNTLAKIAAEKAGIIKEGVPVFTCENKEECLDVFVETAKHKHTTVTRIFFPRNAEIVNGHLQFTYRGLAITLQSTAGYQVENASLACAVMMNLKEELSKVSDTSIIKGLSSTEWAGRFETIATQPLTIIDGAHNQEGVNALVRNYAQCPKPIITIFSALEDKPFDRMLETLMDHSDQVIVTEFANRRNPGALTLSSHFDVIVETDYIKAIEQGRNLVGNGTLIITGSLYFISEVRQFFLEENH